MSKSEGVSNKDVPSEDKETNKKKENIKEKPSNDEEIQTKKENKKDKQSDDKETQKKKESKQQNIDKIFQTLESYQNKAISLDECFKQVSEFYGVSNAETIKRVDDNAKEDAIESVRKEIGHCNELINRDSLTPTDVIENASALTGVYYTNDKKEFIKKRKQLLIVNGHVHFKLPTLSQIDEVKEFQSQEQRDIFNRTIDSSGWSAAIGMNVAKFGIGARTGYCYETKQQVEDDNSTNEYCSYFSKVSCCVVPVKLWEPDLSHLCFSKPAVNALSNIETLLSLNKTQEALAFCELFFHDFGSHFNKNDVHFGGIYKIETTYNSIKKEKSALAKQMVQEMHQASLHAKANILEVVATEIDGSGHYHSGTASSEGKHLASKYKNVNLTESKYGGPLEINSLQLWKTGLINCNSTWAVIDKGNGDFKKYVGVWDIVKSKMSLFKNPLKLSSLLKEKWHRLAGINETTDISGIDTISTYNELFDLVQNITQQVKDDDSSKSYVAVVHELYTKVRAIKNTLGDTEVWKRTLEVNNDVAKIFQKVISMEIENVDELQVRHDMAFLLNDTENMTFHNKQAMISWLNKKPSDAQESSVLSKNCDTIEELILLTEDFLRQVRLRKENYNEPITCLNTFITVELAKAISKLMGNLKIQANNLEYILFLALIIPFEYDIEDKGFRSQVTIKKLESFCTYSNSVIFTYTDMKGVNFERRLAWIMYGMISKLQQTDTDNANVKILNIVTHMKSVGKEITIPCLNHTKEDAFVCLEPIKRSLKCIIDGIPECEDVISWNFFEQLPDSFFEKIRHYGTKGSPEEIHSFEDYGSTLSKEMSDMLNRLELSSYFPGKLSFKDVMAIRVNLFKKPVKWSEIPGFILRTLFSSNFHFREKVLDDFIKTSNNSMSKDLRENNDLFNDLDEDSDQEIAADEQQMGTSHPLDIFMCIFVCCDAFLQRLIIQKLSGCQLAIPLVYQDFVKKKPLALTLWPVREIVVQTVQGSFESVVTKKIHTISFLRIGQERSRSKSKLINEFLRDQNEEHNTFFHRDCPLGMNKRTITDGMIEASWFSPSCMTENSDKGEITQQQDDRINCPLAVFNLRGNAYEYETQTDILLFTSSVIIILIKYDDMANGCYMDMLSKIHKNDARVILVIVDTPNDKKRIRTFLNEYKENVNMDSTKTKTMATFSFKKQRELNVSEIKKDLTGHIITSLKHASLKPCLEQLTVQFANVLNIDEKCSHCVKGKMLASSISSEIKCIEEPTQRKNVILPLQGKSWHTLSQKQREQCTRQTKGYDTKEIVLNEMKNIRQTQIADCNNAPTIVAMFVRDLLQNINDGETIQFIVFWLKQYLDNEARSILPLLRLQLREAFTKYERSRSEQTENAVKKAENSLVLASFGIEQFFREIGQIHDAFMYCKEHIKCKVGKKTILVIEYLPVIAAKLLLLGIPLEIMDGDAENVPLRWIKAVFEKLRVLNGMKRVLCLSVLGIQSSGKSTLLNTMFGLQFSVSAGRCTRGIFIQLVPIYRTLSSSQFDYLMVTDTEGLRAPELGQINTHHDNKLATLVTGMGDIVIINMKGETIADMENILQIVVFGLIRLKQANDELNLRQSCLLVHQNVSAQDADKHMMQGNKVTVNNLDKMTKEVSEQQHMGNIKTFHDVIEFKPLEDVKYVPDLWYGSPPMAPISTKYSERVMEVAKCILGRLTSKEHHYFNLEEMYLHLESLWSAILSENFAFSFRNCLEVKAYCMLESEYQRLIWVLEELTLNWVNESVCQQLKKCNTVNDLAVCAGNLNISFTRIIDKKFKEVEDGLETFVQQSELSENMLQWKDGQHRNLQEKSNGLLLSVKRKIQEEKQLLDIELNTCNVQQRKEKEINNKARALADSLKGKQPSDKEIHGQFEELWVKWINEITPEIQTSAQEKKQHMETSIIHSLHEKFILISTLITKGLNNKGLGNSDTLERLKYSLGEKITNDHIDVIGTKNTIRKYWTKYGYGNSGFKEMVNNVINDIFEEIDDHFNNLFRLDTQYDSMQFSKILNMITRGFNEHNDKSANNPFTLRPALLAMVVLHVARYSYKQFHNLNQLYMGKHSLYAKLKSYKPKAMQLFIDTVKAKTNEIIASNFLLEELKDLVKEKVRRGIPMKIKGQVIRRFNYQKYHLIKTVLQDLCKGDDFDMFMSYIRSPGSYTQRWLNKLVDTDIFGRGTRGLSLYAEWTSNTVSAITENLRNAATFVIQHKKPATIHQWLKEFCIQLEKENLMITRDSFHHVMTYSITDFDSFLQCVTERLYKMEEELKLQFASQVQTDIQWTDTSPQDMIVEYLWGCNEKCPWCGEPCQKANANHVNDPLDRHMCIQHRPTGVHGTRWIYDDKLCIESCNFHIQSTKTRSCGNWCGCSKKKCTVYHPCKEYRTYMPRWDIAPSSTMDSSKYWQWFITTHKTQLAEHYNTEPPDIPESWLNITQQDAIDSLSVYV